jgi:hypothetical protein
VKFSKHYPRLPNKRLESAARKTRAAHPERYATGAMLRALKDRRLLRRAWRGRRCPLGTGSDHRVHGRSAIVACGLTYFLGPSFPA